MFCQHTILEQSYYIVNRKGDVDSFIDSRKHVLWQIEPISWNGSSTFDLKMHFTLLHVSFYSLINSNSRLNLFFSPSLILSVNHSINICFYQYIKTSLSSKHFNFVYLNFRCSLVPCHICQTYNTFSLPSPHLKAFHAISSIYPVVQVCSI